MQGDGSGGVSEASAAAGWKVGVLGLDAGLDWREDDSESECKAVCGDEQNGNLGSQAPHRISKYEWTTLLQMVSQERISFLKKELKKISFSYKKCTLIMFVIL